MISLSSPLPPLAPPGLGSALAPLPPCLNRERLLDAPEALHPALWRAQGGGRSAGVRASGYARLDAELPGGGWPVRALTELLLPRSGIGEIRLLAPMLAALAREGRVLMLFEPPAQLSAEGLEQIGLPPASCLVVRIRPGRGPSTSRVPAPGLVAAADLCWALEQALRSGQLGAVLAWPGALARPEWLRRLQLAAQSHEGPAFLLRELAARSRPSPAPLRLALQPVGADLLGVQILKRRGPALAWPLRLALQPVLSERAQARAASLQALPLGQPQAPGPAYMPDNRPGNRLGNSEPEVRNPQRLDVQAAAQPGSGASLQPAGRLSPP